jgi:WbqC-like protein family
MARFDPEKIKSGEQNWSTVPESTERGHSMKKVAIVQSNYIPWKGYFDLIAAADEFIVYDDMQYTRRDWRNRNKIKTPHGLQWLTIPVRVKGNYHQRIRDVEIANPDWTADHWKTLTHNYKRANYFDEIADLLAPTYEKSYRTLSQLNRRLIETLCRYIGIETKISNSWDYTLTDGKSERLVDLCVQAGATEYISGPSAKDYIDEGVFVHRGIKLTWFEYSGYPEYPQLWGTFEHGVTILDLLFNCGGNAHRYMRCARS